MSDFTLKINGKRFDFFNRFEVSLSYNSVADTFSFEGLVKTDEQKQLFKPLSYQDIEVYFRDELLITGVILSISTSIENQNTLASLAGYSKTGVLEDCEIPLSTYPLQQDKLTIKQITEKLIKPFGIKLIIDPEVATKANKKYTKTTADLDQKVKDYITELAQHRDILVTHDNADNLLFTKLNSKSLSVANFYEGMPSTSIGLSVDGQSMHSDITVQKQATIESDQPGVKSIKNPLVSVYRPTVSKLSSGDNDDSETSAKDIRASELRSILLTIKTDRILYKNGLKESILRPNMMIDVESPSNFINTKTKWFIEKATYAGDETGISCTFECVLPECYNGLEPKNIFE